ncbi:MULTISPECIES: hypothetical protein [unclassified Mesorhizobium]|uniref:hypothetical protein n=1 Tax=unclassified Mesorhizobium TaxID=325217 RepID=UPI001FEFFA99|nr:MULTISPECIES: hypothetical protein [unclassified Mesorhizobium]
MASLDIDHHKNASLDQTDGNKTILAKILAVIEPDNGIGEIEGRSDREIHAMLGPVCLCLVSSHSNSIAVGALHRLLYTQK